MNTYSPTELNATTRQLTVRRRRAPLLAATVAGLAAAGLLAWSLNGGLHTSDRGHAADPVTTAGPVTSAPTTPTTPAQTPAAPVAATDLLTPEGARGMVEAIRVASGDATITQLVIYPDYASARVVAKDNPKHYDTLNYRAGKVTSRPGGTLGSNDKPVDLTRIDWAQLPSGLARAQAELAVAAPKSRYLLVDYGWFADEITMRYYLADDHGTGGYLTTGATGKVLKIAKSD